MSVGTANTDGVERARRTAERAEDDAAALAVVLAVSGMATAPAAADPDPARTVWGDPGHRLRIAGPGGHGWWASGLPS